jgi:type IV pilus assembly protein PilY1
MPEIELQALTGAPTSPSASFSDGSRRTCFSGLITGLTQKHFRACCGNDRGNHDEIDEHTPVHHGQGIIRHIDKCASRDYSYGDYSYNENCGWITTRAISRARPHVGNPIAEMMYEACAIKPAPGSPLRPSPTAAPRTTAPPRPAFAELGRSLRFQHRYSRCSHPFMWSSATSTSFDPTVARQLFRQLRGSLGSLNVASGTDISGRRGKALFSYYIAVGRQYRNVLLSQVCGPVGQVLDCAPRSRPSRAPITRPACPLRKTHDLNTPTAPSPTPLTPSPVSPLPRIEIRIQNRTITLVPFAKSGAVPASAHAGQFSAHNTNVDVFVRQHPHLRQIPHQL